MRANLPDAATLRGRRIPGASDLQLVEICGSGNNGHVFRAHSAQLQRDFACKIVPVANLVRYGDEEAWRQEIEKANALRSASVVKFSAIYPWKDADIGLDAVAFVSDFVVGSDLRRFIKEKRVEIDVPLVREFLATMLDLLNEMVTKQIEHGDLHDGNILVEDRSYALTGPRYAFRVTDFGVSRVASDAVHKDDFIQLAEILRKMLGCIDYQRATPRDKYVYNVLNNEFLARHLVERDPTRDALARNPKDLFARLEALQFEFDAGANAEARQLLTPFDFLSCEQIGDSAVLLQALYSERFLGLDQIESRNNTVVTGPRGCGKSTVFKCLSLKHRIRVSDAAADTVRYVGIYYRCDDLYFSFPRYKTPARDEAIDLPCHFLSATLLGELLDVIESWGRRCFQQEFQRSELAVANRIWQILGVPIPTRPGAESFQAIRSELAKQRVRAANKVRFAHDPKHAFGDYFGVDVLPRVCEALSQSFEFLRERPFYFFIDDYSSPKITRDLQENLNRIFMQRLPYCFFKLSTESPVSYSKGDVDKKLYVEGREFILHNLGLIYLHSSPEPKLEFIEDVFRRRLTASSKEYPVREIEDLLGSSGDQNNNYDARRLRGGHKIELWGKETLGKLCSGDIHYVIQVVRDMVVNLGGEGALRGSAHKPRIPKTLQNKAIREAAGVFLKNLRSIPMHGDRVVTIVTAFGNVARSYLQYRNSKNEKGRPPHQATRIEPYESLDLPPEARTLYDELLRYSVFIEDFRGKSRRGKVVPRLYLRRFLIPHFNLTFSNRDSVSLEPEDFKLFLLEPGKFEEKFRIKSEEQAKQLERLAREREKREKQMPLGLGDGGNGEGR